MQPSIYILSTWLQQIAAGKVQRLGKGAAASYTNESAQRLNRPTIFALEDAGLVMWKKIKPNVYSCLLTVTGHAKLAKISGAKPLNVLFADAYVVAVTAKWCEGSVDSKVYTEKSEAAVACKDHNRKMGLEGKYAAEVLDLNDYMSMMEISRLREMEAGEDL